LLLQGLFELFFCDVPTGYIYELNICTTQSQVPNA
jgi:hypothetical protein